MFDESLPEPGRAGGLSDAELIDAMAGWASVSAAADARRLAMIAEFTARRLADDQCADWAVDELDAASVEVAAALNISGYGARTQMELGLALRRRFPIVAARYAAGSTDARTVTTIVARTDNVQDPEALAALDTALAQNLTVYGPLSRKKLETAIDLWVTAIDPDAVIRTRRSARDREIGFGDPGDRDGVVTIWGRLLATDATLLDARLTAMANAVCREDPRTQPQRRADALGALAAGKTHLACACGSPACPADPDDGRATTVVIHVLAEAATIAAAQPDPHCHGQHRPGPGEPPHQPAIGPDGKVRLGEASTDAPAASTAPKPGPRTLRPAVIVGGPIIPAPLLAELIAAGAKVKDLTPPPEQPHPRYRPSTAQDTWIRLRDLTCRAPGCDKPATHADIDHTIPWPAGVTHPSNTKCYCRFHHLVKTFWDGFNDHQNPDGSIEFSTPTGHTYITEPFSTVLFPAASTRTAKLPDPKPQPPPSPARGLKMPKRKRTRARERQYRIDRDRALNHAENPPPPF